MKYEDKDRKIYLQKLNAFAAELVKDTEKSSSLLKSAGIINKNGKFTEQYRSMSVCCVQDSK